MVVRGWRGGVGKGRNVTAGVCVLSFGEDEEVSEAGRGGGVQCCGFTKYH